MEEKYKFSEETKQVYSCERRTKTNIIRYEYERKDNGWFISREWYNIDSGIIPKENEVYIPDEVMNDIISKHTQTKLSE